MKKWTGIGLVAAVLAIGMGLAPVVKLLNEARRVAVASDSRLDTIDLAKATGYGQTGNVLKFLSVRQDGQVAPGLADQQKSKDKNLDVPHS